MHAMSRRGERRKMGLVISIRLSEPLFRALDEAVKELGYYSRGELIREVLRKFLLKRMERSIERHLEGEE